MKLPVPPLMVITDRRQAKLPLDRVVEAVYAGGGRWVSLREKTLAIGPRRQLASRLVKIARRHGGRLTVHGDIAICEATRADGVHISGTEVAPHQVRRWLGPEALIGVSVHSWDEAVAAQENGADYVTVSPVFETASKPGYGPVLGLEILGEFCQALDVPVVALGGLTPERAAECLAAGASGVAVMGEIMRAEDPTAATRAFVEALAPAPE